MPFTSEYQNFINPLSIVVDAASENLVQRSVWLQHVVRVAMPTETQSVEVRKKGSLGRLVLPENTEYTYGAYSEYGETSTLLNPIKSTVISRVTKEAEKFNRTDPMSAIGEEQGKALGVGAEEDIATLAAGFSSEINTAAGPATQLDLQAAALEVSISTNGHAVQDGNIVAVLHPKTAFEIGIENVLDPTSGALQVFANPASSSTRVLESMMSNNKPRNGFVANQYGLDIYVTNIIDDDGTDYRNLVFDRSRAIVGLWDDAVDAAELLDIEFFRNRLSVCWFSDFAMHWDEAGCRLEAPVL
jgi:hypothetical protein